MIKELKEEIRYAVNHPIQFILIMGMFSGFIPAFIEAVVNKII